MDNSEKFLLPKVGDIVLTPRGNRGKVTKLSIDGKDATVLITEGGRTSMVNLPRRDLKVMVKK
jgi:hypothetical protein